MTRRRTASSAVISVGGSDIRPLSRGALVTFDRTYRFGRDSLSVSQAEYIERFATGRFFDNRYYLSLILKYDDFDDGLKEIESLGQQALLQLVSTIPRFLTVYERTHMNGTKMLFSKQYGFISDLINGVTAEKPVAAESGSDVIPSSWLHFGYNTLAIRGPGVPDSRAFATCSTCAVFRTKPGWGQLESTADASDGIHRHTYV